jgi:hypothetical protein
VNFHVRPYWAARLPAIATFFGVGMTPDAAPVAALSPKEMPRAVHAVEVAYLLGQDRARAYAPALAFPALGAAAESGRSVLAKARRGPDLYAAWLGAVRDLAAPPQDGAQIPSFMETQAFADTRVASAMVGYGQIRHAYVLHAVQPYDEGGCRIPDAWVEPVPRVYESILSYAKRLQDARAFLPERAAAWADEASAIVGALHAIAVDELAGRPLSQTQQDFLAMVAEYRHVSGYTRGRPLYNGWYPKLFADKSDAFDHAPFLSDFFTSTYEKKISYVGALEPRLGIFVVDVAGEPRVMVGPVTRAIQRSDPIGTREDDDDVYRLYHPEKGYASPWEKSHVGDMPREPFLDVSVDGETFTVTPGEPALGDVTVETIDEHEHTLARGTVRTAKKDARIEGKLTPIAGRTGELQRLRVRVGGAVWLSLGATEATLRPERD